MRELFALDVETKGIKGMSYAALEPWRVRQGKAYITAVSVCDPGGLTDTILRRDYADNDGFLNALVKMLENLEGANVYCHNGVFDLAFNIASLQPKRCGAIPSVIRNIKWHDTMLLAKWLVNGQKAERISFSYSLLNLAQCFLEKHPQLAEFVEMKSKPFQETDDTYWEERNVLDVIMTQALAEFFEENLPADQRPGYKVEMRNLIPVANSWITGIRIDQKRLEEIRAKFTLEMEGIIDELGISPSVLTSPKQLGNLLFNELKVNPVSYTPTGAPSTAADDIKLIAFNLVNGGDEHRGRLLNMIRRYKELSTLMSKYIKGAEEALAHTGDGYIYGAPRIFGTYTGRFTYSSKTLDTYKTSIALHQIPRKDKDVRSMMVPPEGMKVYEADAAGQESRLMAIRSGDQAMLKVFTDKLDFHSMTGSGIVGTDYNEFYVKYKGGDLRATEDRQMGKLSNLSCNYRIGGKALAQKAFEDYDIVMSIDKGQFLVNSFNRTYPGVPQYWESVIKEARAKGYTEAYGGRRYKIFDWSNKFRWASESSAINTPIQGAGAAMKNIAIAEVFDKVPDEATFILDLHDATFYYVPEDETGKKIDHTLANIDYKQYWGFEIPIPLPYDSKLGNSWAEVK